MCSRHVPIRGLSRAVLAAAGRSLESFQVGAHEIINPSSSSTRVEVLDASGSVHIGELVINCWVANEIAFYGDRPHLHDAGIEIFTDGNEVVTGRFLRVV